MAYNKLLEVDTLGVQIGLQHLFRFRVVLPINSLICWCKSGNKHSLPYMANLFLAI